MPKLRILFAAPAFYANLRRVSIDDEHARETGRFYFLLAGAIVAVAEPARPHGQRA